MASEMANHVYAGKAEETDLGLSKNRVLISKVGLYGAYHHKFSHWLSEHFNEAKRSAAIVSPVKIRETAKANLGYLSLEIGTDFNDVKDQLEAVELNRFRKLVDNGLQAVIYDKAFNSANRRERMRRKFLEDTGYSAGFSHINVVFHAGILTILDRIDEGSYKPSYVRRISPGYADKVGQAMTDQYDSLVLPAPDDGEPGLFIHIDTENLRPGQVVRVIGNMLLQNF